MLGLGGRSSGDMLPLGRRRRDRMADPPAVNAHHVAWSHRWPRSCRTGDNRVPSNQRPNRAQSFDHLFEIDHTPILGVPWPPVAPPHRPARPPRSSTTRSRRSARRPATGSRRRSRRRRRPRRDGWAAIAAGHHTLIHAPTGSGKTLAAFLWCLDRLVRDPSPPADPRAPGQRPGPVRLAAQGADLRRRAQPAGAARRDRPRRRPGAATRPRRSRSGCGPATRPPRSAASSPAARPTS